MLSRVYALTGETFLIQEAKRSVQYCVNFQQPQGEWAYSPLPFHSWIDNFHTGYNLECIHEYMKFSGDLSYEANIINGLDYYLKTFFSAEGMSRYYSNSTFPIDVHAPALVDSNSVQTRFTSHA